MTRLGSLAGWSLLSLAALLSCTPSPPTYQNLVLIMIDTLRSDHVSSYGYRRRTTPFLDGLAAEGVQLQGYSVSSWTKPSIATLLTGLYPQRHQAIGRRDVLAVDLPYLPEILQDSGRTTVAFISNLNAGRKWGFGRGFSEYLQTRPVGKLDGSRVNRRVLPLLDALQPPFALYLHYVDPHDPYRPDALRFGEPSAGFVQPRRVEATDEDAIESLINQYDSEILELDGYLRQLFEELLRRELLGDTLVIVTADHGEEFGEHGRLTHGHGLYEEVLRVPFVAWAEEGLAPWKSAQPFHQVDFLPTILEALGVAIPEGLDGSSRWRDLVERRELPKRLEGFHLDVDDVAALGLLDGPRKFIHRLRRPHDLLFDLGLDPREQHALDDAEMLEDLRAESIRLHNRLQSTAPPRATETIGPQLRRALAALGYVSDSNDQGPPPDRLLPDRLTANGFAALGN